MSREVYDQLIYTVTFCVVLAGTSRRRPGERKRLHFVADLGL